MKIASKFVIVFMTLTNSTTFHEAWGVDSKKFCIRNSQKEPLYPRRQRCFLVWWHTPKHALTTQKTMEMSVQFKINMTLAATVHWWEWTRDWTIHARWETPYLPSCIVLSAISTLRNCSALVNQAMAPGPPNFLGLCYTAPWFTEQFWDQIPSSWKPVPMFPILSTLATYHLSPMRSEAVNYLPWFPKHLMWGLKHTWRLMNVCCKQYFFKVYFIHMCMSFLSNEIISFSKSGIVPNSP